MFLLIAKKPRKTQRNRTARFRAKIKAKFKVRKAKLYNAHRK